jgi:magnesium-transporting ATPase (P-type)
LREIGWTSNRLVWWGVLSELVVIALVVYVPVMQRIFGTAPFPAVGWAFLLLGIPLLPIVDGTRKALIRHRRRR